jgi:soluble lytic murein transglycosylase-like protein
MGSTAREYGLRGWITDLCNPLVGIRFGVRYLVSRARLYGWDRDSAIAAYNAGSARRLLRRAGEPFVNQEYVDKVLAAMDHPEAPE